MRQLSPVAYRRLTLFAVLALAAIVVTGATVRLTGSGLGCSDWPNCEQGQLTAQLDDAPAMVEFVNRLVTGLVSVAVIVAVLGARRREPRRRDLVLLAWGLVVGVIVQILLGKLVVEEALSPKLVQAHFLVSMVLLWNAVVLHERAASDEPRTRTAPRAWVTLAVAAVVVCTGTIVTASGPHAGDVAAERLGFHVEEVARIHGIAVVALFAVALVLRARSRGELRRASNVLLVVLAAQAAIGYTQYFTGVPALLVGAHIVGAVSVWIAAVRVTQVGRTATPADDGHAMLVA